MGLLLMTIAILDCPNYSMCSWEIILWMTIAIRQSSVLVHIQCAGSPFSFLLSNFFIGIKLSEPGYCEDGNFGIRLENVLIVNDAGTKFNFGDKCYLSFEHITWAPYQQKLIDLSLLMPEEVDWLNTYHSKCRDVSASYTNESDMAWLKKATEPICA
ncbi:aminopeptidase P1-like [Camellia sinensis]|uniref:aminopeptidase P1-like n=1 Tax=Camellia sinensis TaxID=4442 RepID=UPI00103582BC|nr:aminopeptidase P1-like [Camellia sinensis]